MLRFEMAFFIGSSIMGDPLSFLCIHVVMCMLLFEAILSQSEMHGRRTNSLLEIQFDSLKCNCQKG